MAHEQATHFLLLKTNEFWWASAPESCKYGDWRMCTVAAGRAGKCYCHAGLPREHRWAASSGASTRAQGRSRAGCELDSASGPSVARRRTLRHASRGRPSCGIAATVTRCVRSACHADLCLPPCREWTRLSCAVRFFQNACGVLLCGLEVSNEMLVVCFHSISMVFEAARGQTILLSPSRAARASGRVRSHMRWAEASKAPAR